MIDFIGIVQQELATDKTLPETLKARVLERAQTMQVEPERRSRLISQSHSFGPNAVNTNARVLLRGVQHERASETTRPHD